MLSKPQIHCLYLFKVIAEKGTTLSPTLEVTLFKSAGFILIHYF